MLKKNLVLQSDLFTKNIVDGSGLIYWNLDRVQFGHWGYLKNHWQTLLILGFLHVDFEQFHANRYNRHSFLLSQKHVCINDNI